MTHSSLSEAQRIKLAQRGVPILLALFVFCLVIDQGFKFMTNSIAGSLDISLTTASLQVTIPGIILAVGIVVYSTMADMVSMRKLLLAAIIFLVIGSAIGLLGRESWALILTGRFIQTAGIAAAETLYVIYVSKNFTGELQKRYFGYSTAAFQFSGMLGVVGAGFASAYIHWSLMFALPILAIISLPFLKTIPREEDSIPVDDETEEVKQSLDILGLFAIAVMSAGVVLWIQNFNHIWLLAVLGGLALFIIDMRANPKAIVDAAFFKTPRFVLAITIVFIMYTAYMGFVFFVFPVAVPDIFGLTDDAVALLMLPGYIAGSLVGVFTGVISKFLNSKRAIYASTLLSAIAIALAAVFIHSALWVVVLGLAIYLACDSLMYAPLISTAVEDIPVEKSGIAIGFYNLIINIGFPVGAAYTAKLLDVAPTFMDGVAVGSAEHPGYTTTLWILAFVALFAFIVYSLSINAIERREKGTR